MHSRLLALIGSGMTWPAARRPAPARKREQQPADQSRAADERRRLVETTGRGKRDRSQRGERDIDRKNVRHHLADRKAAVGCTLIKMRAVRLPDLLAIDRAADERDGRVGEIVERQ